jgi:hypothetical protein
MTILDPSEESELEDMSNEIIPFPTKGEQEIKRYKRKP